MCDNEIIEQNKELSLKMMEAWGKGDFETYKALLAPDFSFHYPFRTLSVFKGFRLGRRRRGFFLLL